jgi:hypothetical protein
MAYFSTMAGVCLSCRPAVPWLLIGEEMCMWEWMYLEGTAMVVEDITQTRYMYVLHE